VSVPRCAGAIALAAVLAGAGPARGSTWSEAFAAETDTTVFLAADGSLVKAPFSLATRETLWVPQGTEFVVRFTVSPDARRVAWLTRVGDQGLTWLWSWDAAGTRSLVGFPSLEAGRWGALRYEAATPTVDDPMIRGGRLVQVSARMRRPFTNALEWSTDGNALAFGFDLGLGLTSADSGRAREISATRILGLRLLDPAPFYLAEAMVESGPAPETQLEFDPLPRPSAPRATGAAAHWYLAYPAGSTWKLYEASSFDGQDPWSADGTTVWWADRKVIRAVRAHDPQASVALQAGDEVVWLEYDAARAALAWVEGRKLMRRRASGGEISEILHTREPCRRVIGGRGAAHRGLVAGDSLVLWNPADDSRFAVALEGRDPRQLIDNPQGVVLVVAARGQRAPPALFRVDRETSRLVATDSPELKGALALPSPSRRAVLWVRPGVNPAARLAVYDLASGRWSEVENPGVSAWEPLAPW
jgi:hypothetical protein